MRDRRQRLLSCNTERHKAPRSGRRGGVGGVAEGAAARRLPRLRRAVVRERDCDEDEDRDGGGVKRSKGEPRILWEGSCVHSKVRSLYPTWAVLSCLVY